MTTIRMLTGLLLLINGILHIALYIKMNNDPGSIGILSFGIIYIITGFLLFNKKKIPCLLRHYNTHYRDDIIPDKIRSS